MRTGKDWKGNNQVYRCTQPLAERAAWFAKLWATIPLDKEPFVPADHVQPAATEYGGMSDAPGDFPGWVKVDSGVEEEKEKRGGHPPPFVFDSLCRALLWASRRNNGFDIADGTTCCGFVLGCYQAAALWELAGSDGAGDHARSQRIEFVLNSLEKIRGTSLMEDVAGALKGKDMPEDFEDALHHNYTSVLSYRSTQNRGILPSAMTSLQDAWEWAVEELSKRPVERTLESVFTGPMLIDAKFVYSAQLAKIMEPSPPDWDRMDFEY
jgi:hypothetical protein